MSKIKNVWQQYRRHIAWLIVILTILYILRSLIIEWLRNLMGKSWFSCIDQTALGIVFLVTCILSCVYIWWKYAKYHTIISGEYVVVAVLLATVYLYLRIDGTIYFYKVVWKIAYCDFLFLPVASILILLIHIIHRIKVQKTCNTKDKKELTTLADHSIKFEKDDELGFGKIIDVLLSDIKHADLSESAFSIGIVGTWGQGKTSFINLLKAKVDPANTDKDKSDKDEAEKNRPIFLQFNPRNSKNIEAIAEDFFNMFATTLHQYHSGIKSMIRKYASALQIAFNDNIIGKGITFFQELNPVQDKRKINQAIEEIGRTIYIVIDDLDRLTAKEILEVLKLIDRNADFKQTVFITAYDKNYVNEVLKSYLGYQNDYFIDKYFNFELSLPVPNADSIFRVTRSCLDHATAKDDMVRQELINFWDQAGRDYTHYFSNIRHIKRFVNILLNRFENVHEDVNVEDFFCLTLIRYYDIESYNALALRKYLTYNILSINGSRILYCQKDFQQLLHKGYWDYIPEILGKLFPKEKEERSDTYQRICDTGYFDLYFYDYKEGRLYLKQLSELFTIPDDKQAIRQFEEYMEKSNRDLFRFLENITPVWIGTKEKLVRYLTLCLQFRTHCGNQNFSLIRQLCIPLLTDHYKEYKEVLGVGQEEYQNEILKIYDSLIPKYPYQLQPIFQLIYQDDGNSELVPVLTRNISRDCALQCQKTFLDHFDEQRNTVQEAFTVSNVFPKQNAKCDDEASKTLLQFMDKHKDFVATNIFSFNVGKGGDGSLLQLSLSIDKVYDRFSLWFPIEGKSFMDWVNSINNVKLRDIISEIYSQANQVLIVKALKSSYSKDDIEGIWTAIQSWKDNRDIDLITRAIKNDEVYDLTTLCQSTNLQSERIQQLAKKYRSRLFDLHRRYLSVMTPFETNDIVRLKKKTQSQLGMTVNLKRLFRIESLKGKNKCMLQGVDKPIDISDLLPVLINSEYDHNIYYNHPIVERSIDAFGQPTSTQHIDYRNYLEAFKDLTINQYPKYTYIMHQNFSYVHEIQHWLRDRFHDDYLEIIVSNQRI